jgi:hypothetical protein
MTDPGTGQAVAQRLALRRCLRISFGQRKAFGSLRWYSLGQLGSLGFERAMQ